MRLGRRRLAARAALRPAQAGRTSRADDPGGALGRRPPARRARATRRGAHRGRPGLGPLAPATCRPWRPPCPRTAYRVDAHRLCAHTLGNPRHLLALLAESPPDRWRGWEPVLPAPRVFSRTIVRRLAPCSADARLLVEAVAALGDDAPLATAAALADVDEPLEALEERATPPDCSPCPRARTALRAWRSPQPACAGGGLRAVDAPSERSRLHREAARLVDDDSRWRSTIALRPRPSFPTTRWRLSCSAPPTRRPAWWGEWAEAAWALLKVGRLSAHREQSRAHCVAGGRPAGRCRGGVTSVPASGGRPGGGGGGGLVALLCRPLRRTACCTARGRS